MPIFDQPAAGAGTPTADSQSLFWDGTAVRSLTKKALIKALLGFIEADGSPPDSDLAAALASLEGMTGSYLAKPTGGAAVGGAPVPLPGTPTGNDPQTLGERFGDAVSLMDFVPAAERAAIRAQTSVYDCTTALTNALNASDVVYVPKGRFEFTTGAISNISGKTVVGSGRDSILSCATRIFERTTSFDYFSLQSLRFVGGWQAAQTQGGDTNRFFYLANGDLFTMSDVYGEYSRQMSFTAAFVQEVICHNIHVSYSGRDAINLTGCKRVEILGGSVRHCYDDAVAIHQTAAESAPFDRYIRVIGMYIEDSFGIKAMGGRLVVIANNIIHRPKGYGVFIGHDGSSTEGRVSTLDISVLSNIIKDWYRPTILTGPTSTNDGAIEISSYATNYNAPVVGGATPTINKPESFIDSQGASAQHVGGRRIRVDGNILVKERPGGVAYSTWGYGSAWTATGDQDPTIPTGTPFSVGYGIRVSGPIDYVMVGRNHIEGVSQAFACATSANLREAEFAGNSVRRCSGRVVQLDSNAALLQCKLISRGNRFNLDPYFESASRTQTASVIDGGWDGTNTNCIPLSARNIGALVSDGDTFENCNRIYHTSGSGLPTVNVSINEPIVIGDPLNGRGVGSLSSPAQVVPATVVTTDSDPRNSTYGNVTYVVPLFKGKKIVAASTAVDYTPDLALGNHFELTVTAAIKINNPTNLFPGMRFGLTIIQGSPGGSAITFDTEFKKSWSDTGNTTGKISTVEFYASTATIIRQDGAQMPYV